MKQVGYGVRDAKGKPVGIWPTSLAHATRVLERRKRDHRGDEVVPVYVGTPVPRAQLPKPEAEKAPA